MELIEYFKQLYSINPPSSYKDEHGKLIEWVFNSIVDLVPDLEAEGDMETIVKEVERKLK